MFTHVACACVHIRVPNFFWCFLDTSMNIVPSFTEIRPHLLQIWGFVYGSKLRACFYMLCMHVRVCMHSSWKCACNLGQKTNPHISGKWSQIFMKLGTMFKEVSSKHHVWDQYVHACTCNAHKCACTFQYLVIVFKQCRNWGWWRKWKLFRRVQCILTTIVAPLRMCAHARRP